MGSVLHGPQTDTWGLLLLYYKTKVVFLSGLTLEVPTFGLDSVSVAVRADGLSEF